EDTEYVFDAWDGTPLDVDAMLANRTEKGRSRASSSKGGSKAYGAAALHHAVEAVRAATPGGRNVTLNREAYGIGQLVAGGVIDETEARDALRAAAVEAGLEAGEIERTLDGGFRAGAKGARTGRGEGGARRAGVFGRGGGAPPRGGGGRGCQFRVGGGAFEKKPNPPDRRRQ